jgi:putative transposase
VNPGREDREFSKEGRTWLKRRFSEEQIIGILNEAAAGAAAVELCRRHGISETTFYRWKAKFGGLAVSDAKRLRQLEAENITPEVRSTAEVSRLCRSMGSAPERAPARGRGPSSSPSAPSRCANCSGGSSPSALCAARGCSAGARPR